MKTTKSKAAHAAYHQYQLSRARFDGTDKAARVIAADAGALLKAQRAARLEFYPESSLRSTIAGLMS
jgi:hypothetical protein